MLPQPKRAEFVEAFGEKKTKALEDMVNLLAKAADDSGIEKKELPLSFADLDRQLKAMEAVNGVMKLTDQYQQLITNLANEYISLVTVTVSQKEKKVSTKDATTQLKEGESLDAYLRRIMKEGTAKEKAAPAPYSGPSMFAPRTLAGVAPIFGGPANVNKDNAPDGTPLGNIFAANQSYGKPPAAQPGNIIDALLLLNQRWGKGG